MDLNYCTGNGHGTKLLQAAPVGSLCEGIDYVLYCLVLGPFMMPAILMFLLSIYVALVPSSLPPMKTPPP